MSQQMDMDALGQQLRCPHGMHAAEVGEQMYHSNGNMIHMTIDRGKPASRNRILEIGFGNARHLDYLFTCYPDAFYQGADISEAMIREAEQNQAQALEAGKAQFLRVNGTDLAAFGDSSFDFCFTCNTLYFWEDPAGYLAEIFRVLKPSGRLALAFIEKSFGEQLPFTRTEFTFYETGSVLQMLRNAGFQPVSSDSFTETATGKDGQQVTRPFVIVVADKHRIAISGCYSGQAGHTRS